MINFKNDFLKQSLFLCITLFKTPQVYLLGISRYGVIANGTAIETSIEITNRLSELLIIGKELEGQI